MEHLKDAFVCNNPLKEASLSMYKCPPVNHEMKADIIGYSIIDYDKLCISSRLIHSHASFVSKLLRHIANAWKADKGYL